jgi:cobalamin biosynthesis protein CbiM
MGTASMLALHIPDGFIDGRTSLLAALVAIAGLRLCLVRTSATLADRDIPVVGMVAAFVFAAQMLNFPVASGTSGHLLGGALAAVLVGPYAGALAVSVVLIVQALLFADGGLSALGLNIVNMAFCGAFVGFALFALLRRVLPKSAWSISFASGVAAFCVPIVAAMVFTLEYALGGNGAADVHTVAAAMIGVHALIAAGEGVITALVIRTVMSLRPDLVYGARHLAGEPARVVLRGAAS